MPLYLDFFMTICSISLNVVPCPYLSLTISRLLLYSIFWLYSLFFLCLRVSLVCPIFCLSIFINRCFIDSLFLFLHYLDKFPNILILLGDLHCSARPTTTSLRCPTGKIASILSDIQIKRGQIVHKLGLYIQWTNLKRVLVRDEYGS